MNCCDEYGDCRQGRDCPARVAHIGQRHLAAEPLARTVWRENLRALAAYLLISIVGTLLGLAFLMVAR